MYLRYYADVEIGCQVYHVCFGKFVLYMILLLKSSEATGDVFLMIWLMNFTKQEHPSFFEGEVYKF